jgi:hypothetical protein
MPVTIKLGLVDAVPGGLGLEESVPRVARLAGAGIDALEVSVNVMGRATDSVRPVRCRRPPTRARRPADPPGARPACQ